MNKIFKTIWNRARRSYVAVNEAVCGAAQADGKSVGGTTLRHSSVVGKVFALTAIAVAVMQTHATTVTEAGALKGSYDNLSLSGDRGTINAGNFQSESSKKWASGELGATLAVGEREAGRSTSGRPSYLKYLTDEDVYEYSSGNAYEVNGVRYNSYDSYITALNTHLSQYISKDALNTEFIISNGSVLNVIGSLTVGTISQTTEANVAYTYRWTDYTSWETEYFWDYSNTYFEVSKNDSKSASIINDGGLVDIGNLVFENQENSYTQNDGETSIDNVSGDGSVIINDGTLSTNAGVLIDIAEAKAAQIDAKELFAPTTAITVSSLAAGEKSHVSGISATGDQFTINGGTLNIKGTYEQSIANQAETLLKDYYGQNINVTFDEVVADQTLDLTNGYTTAVLMSIYDENGRSDVLFHTLNWNAQNADLTIGSGDMAESIGVKNIDNARQVTVTNGKTFAILGDGAGSSVNGTFVADNGNLVFGAEGLTSGGTVNSVTMRNNASVTVANGIFDMTSVTGNGNFTVAQGATANFDNHTIDGTFSNVGNLNVDGALTFADGSTFTSSGNLTTNQDNVFQNVTPSVIDPLKVIGVAAQMPEEVQTVAAELFRKYVPGEVADALAQHASFTDGLVTITGVNLTETQVADLTQAFKEKLSLTDFLAESNAFPVAFI